MIGPARRRFLRSGLALAGRGVMSGCGQLSLPLQRSARPPRIGYFALDHRDDSTFVRNWEAFRQGLRDLGRIEGQNVAIEVRVAERKPERLPELAAELVEARS